MRHCLAVLVLLLLAAPMTAQERTPTPTAAPDTPTHFFTRYVTALKTAATLEDVSAFWSAQLLARAKQMPPDIFKGLQAGYSSMTDVKVTKEIVSGTGATLTLEATFDGQEKTGTMYLTKKDGAWKLFAPETWQ